MKHTLQNPMTKGQHIFGLCYLLAQQFLLPFLLVLIVHWLGLRLSAVWLNFLFFCLNFVVICLAFGGFLLRDLRKLGRDLWKVLGVCTIGFAVYWATNVLVSIAIMLYLPDFSNANDSTIQVMAQSQYSIMFIGSVLLVPLAEETLFRGVLFGLADQLNRPLAYILSALLFALVHVVGYLPELSATYFVVSLLQYVPAGLCLCWAYARTNTIFAPVLIHTAVNLMGMLAMR